MPISSSELIIITCKKCEREGHDHCHWGMSDGLPIFLGCPFGKDSSDPTEPVIMSDESLLEAKIHRCDHDKATCDYNTSRGIDCAVFRYCEKCREAGIIRSIQRNNMCSVCYAKSLDSTQVAEEHIIESLNFAIPSGYLEYTDAYL